MSNPERHQVIYDRARATYDGKTVPEWAPQAVSEIVSLFAPREVIVFGSVARGETGPDSDLDVLVVLDDLAGRDEMDLQRDITWAIDAPIPCDVIVTDVAAYRERRVIPGTVEYWAYREGRVAYERGA